MRALHFLWKLKDHNYFENEKKFPLNKNNALHKSINKILHLHLKVLLQLFFKDFQLIQ